jgi:hypothetical protein
VAEPLPPGLREEVARTLKPVQPLASPGRRAALLLPVAGSLLVFVPLAWSLRDDAAAVGLVQLWGGSLLQVLVGLVVLAAALGESVPGRLSAPRRLFGAALLGLGFMGALAAATFLTSPTHVPPQLARSYAHICFTRPFVVGLLPLAIALLLIARGLVTRPLVAGALAGLGAGLLTDASWRLFCEVSDPAHVLTAHAAAVGALVLVGAAIGAVGAVVGSSRAR